MISYFFISKSYYFNTIFFEQLGSICIVSNCTFFIMLFAVYLNDKLRFGTIKIRDIYANTSLSIKMYGICF